MITYEVGKRIKERRQSKALSQEKLALKAGLDRTYIAGVESGKRNISLVSLGKLLHALDVSFRDFFDEIEV